MLANKRISVLEHTKNSLNLHQCYLINEKDIEGNTFSGSVESIVVERGDDDGEHIENRNILKWINVFTSHQSHYLIDTRHMIYTYSIVKIFKAISIIWS